MEFSKWWTAYAEAFRRESTEVSDNTPLPAPADVAGGLVSIARDFTRSLAEYRVRIWELWTARRPAHEPASASDSVPFSGRVIDLTPSSPTSIMAGLPPGTPFKLSERLTDGLNDLHIHFLLIAASHPPDVDTTTDKLIAGFEAVHTIWEAGPTDGLKHPLAALIEGWLLRPVEADCRETAILPATLANVRDANAPATLFDLSEHERAPGFTPHPIERAYLPDLAPAGNEIAPALPLLMWDTSTEGGPRRGKGAPLPLRIWIEAVLALPTHERFSTRRVSVHYGDLTGWLMPNGEYRQRDFPAIRMALHCVHNLRLPWELPDGTGGSRSVVVVRDMPRTWNAYDDLVTFEISLPPGVNDRGPLVYRPALRRLGQKAALRYRAELGLCWLWDRYGAHNGRYIQPTRPRLSRDDQDRILDAEETIIVGKDGQPVRTYIVQARRRGKLVRIERPGIVPLDADGRPVPTLADAAQERNPAADRYPVLTPEQQVQLCYPLDLAGKRLTPSAVRKRRERARNALELMAEEGYCVIENADGGLRILPPQGWGAGYGG